MLLKDYIYIGEVVYSEVRNLAGVLILVIQMPEPS